MQWRRILQARILLKNAFSFLEPWISTKSLAFTPRPHTYDNLSWARLTRDAAQASGGFFRSSPLWEAVQAFCEWMVDLAWVARNPEGAKELFRGNISG